MRLTKMHGAGNSFVIVDNAHGELQGGDYGVLALRLCREKHTDGMIVLSPDGDGADLSMLFYNADGSLGEMCGNGARCAARYGVEHGLVRDERQIRIRATAGLVLARRITDELYEIRLNDPSVIELEKTAVLDGETVACSYIELGEPGIPHAVVLAEAAAFDDPDALRERGRALRHSPSFPKGANVSFVCLTGRGRVRAVTFERGVEDFTLACGTGCGAIALSLLLSGAVEGDSLTVDMPGGTLSVTLRRAEGRVCDLLLTGPTALVAEEELSKSKE